MRGVFLALAAVAAFAVSACSDDKPIGKPTEASEASVQKDCTDPKWKEQNLGLWYSVCRKPLQW